MTSFSLSSSSTTVPRDEAELNELNQRLARLDTIDADIQVQRDTASEYETHFYPEMTTYEVSEMAMALLKAANLEAHTISVSPISTTAFSLSYFLPSEVGYQLKSLAAVAKTDTSEGEVIVDGNKTYSVYVNNFSDINITDENGETVAPNKYSETMKKVYKAAACKFAVTNGVTQTLGLMQATYEVKGTYKDYMNFIDHIYSMERATTVPNVVIPMTYTPQAEEDEDEEGNPQLYVNEAGNVLAANEVSSDQQVKVEDDSPVTQSITLMFLAVDPMESLKTVDADGTTIVVDQRPAVY